MAPVAVGKREGYLVVAPSTPLALHDSDHGHVIAPLGRDEDVHLKGRHFFFLGVEGRLWLNDVLPDELGPVNEAVLVLGKPRSREGLGMPAHSYLEGLAGRRGSVSADASGLARGIEVYEA